MAYDAVRGYPPHALSFPNYYYGDRNMPMTIPQAGRMDPRGYPLNNSSDNHRGRENITHEESHVETGPSRRRISVACARCRKRKIRCSGDPGNGTGCTNCKAAGVDPSHCQYHRVGSDHVHKVMDNFHVGNALGGLPTMNPMAPMYSSASNNTSQPRAMNPQMFSTMDTKPTYSSSWAVHYADDTSPVDAYNSEAPMNYLPNSISMSNTALYSRWNQPLSKVLHSSYPDQDSTYAQQGLPCIQTNLRANAMVGSLSPLDMTPLQMVLPERPRTRQTQIPNGNAPQRLLPMPQPSPAQCSRNVVDQLQDQRLRSGRAIPNLTGSGTSVFAKTSPSWTGELDHADSFAGGLGSGVDSEQAANSVSLSSAPDSDMNIFPVTTDGPSTAGTTSQMQLNFSTAAFFDPIVASTSNNAYSNFRDTRNPCHSSSQITREDSQSALYGLQPERTTKGNSIGVDASNDCSLVNGQQYIPLSHAQTHTAAHDRRQRKISENPEKPLQRQSTPSLASNS